MGEVQFYSGLTLMAQVLVPWWNQMHVHIFESLQLEGSNVGDLTVFKSSNLWCFSQAFILQAGNIASKGRRWMTCPPFHFLQEGRSVLQLRNGKEVSKAHDIKRSKGANTVLFCDCVKIVKFYGIKAEVSQLEPPGQFWTFTDFVIHPQRKIGFHIFKWLDKSKEEYYFVVCGNHRKFKVQHQ